MGELVPSLVSLDKGLNLQTAKIVAPVGSVLDTLNYEQVDFQGQKRIDGFVRYDGSTLSAIDDYYKIVLTDTFAGSVGSLVGVTDGLLGVVCAFSTTTVYVVVINENLIPSAADSLYLLDTGSLTAANVIVSIVLGVDSGITAEQHYTNLLAYSDAMRSTVESLPGGVIGLHWFRDRLYAVADVTTISLEGTTPIIYPNDELVLDGGDTVKVLDSYVRDNTRVVFLDSMIPDPWAVEGTDVTRDAVSVGAIANGFEALTVDEEIASFFESRSEAQVLEEDGPVGPYDFGWRFVDHGWSINFADGISLYGSLPSLNQNITGLDTQGPTSITGLNGKALILSQRANITNDIAQVNGWKSSQTPTTYELETDNFDAVDGDTIYADAYISWNGATTEVVGFVEPLVEYPASNTVTVEV